MPDKIIKILTTLAIIAILCLVLDEIWTNIAWGKKLDRGAIDWRIEKIKDLEAQKDVLFYRLERSYNGNRNSRKDNQ